MNLEKCLDEHLRIFDASKSELKKIHDAGLLLAQCLKNGRKILVAGNGGSAADAQHFCAELTGRFEIERHGLSAVALTTDTSAITAIANDFGYEHVFERQVAALGVEGDAFIGISTSGKSPSITNALSGAREKKISTIMLTGINDQICITDYTIYAQSSVTTFIQEFHIFALHCLCRVIEEELYK